MVKTYKTRAPRHRLTRRCLSKAESLALMIHGDVDGAIEVALDLLFIALTKSPQSIPIRSKPSPKNPYRDT